MSVDLTPKLKVILAWLLVATTLSILATAVVWLPEYPPFVDLPQHASNLSMLTDLVSDGDRWSESFRWQWRTPYYGFYLPALLLVGAGVSPAVATKVVASLILILVPIALFAALRVRKLPPALALLSVPTLSGFSIQWGFVSFVAAVGVLILALATMDDVFENRITATRNKLIDWSVFLYCGSLFLLHAHVFAFYLLVLGARWVGTPLRSFRVIFSAAPAVVLALIWFAGVAGTSQQANLQTLWQLGLHRVVDFFPNMLGINTTWMAQLLGVFLVFLPFALGYRLSNNIWHVFPLVLAIFAYFVLPNRLVGGYFTYQRWTVVVIPLYALALARPPEQIAASQKRAFTRNATVTATLLAVALSAAVLQLHRARAFAKEAEGLRAMIPLATKARTMLYLAFDRESQWYAAPAYLHYGQWLAVEAANYMEFNFASFWGMPVVYKDLTSRIAPTNIEWFPNQFDCRSPASQKFDMILVRAEVDLSGPYFANGACSFRLVAHHNYWWLFSRLREN